jgi:glycosyltransferase involved in cell wall biosynthesis
MGLIIGIDAYKLTCEPLTSTAVYITELVKSFELNQNIDKIYLIVPFYPEKDFPYQFLSLYEKVVFIKPDKPFKIGKGWFKQIYWMQKKVLDCLRKSNYTITHFISPYHQVPVFLPKKIKSCVVIHDICGLDTFLYPRLKKGFYKHYFNFITSFLRADVLIPISECTRNQFLKKFSFTRSKMSAVVYNNISAKEASDREMKETLLDFNIQKHAYFLVLGAMSPRKGVDVIIDSFSKYKREGGSRKLIMIVGKNQADSVLSLFNKAVQKDIIIKTEISEATRDSLYKGALALLFPSRCEGFGFPLLEAMVQGCIPLAWINSPAYEIMGEWDLYLKDISTDELLEKMKFCESMSIEERENKEKLLKERSRIFMKNDFGKNFYKAITSFENRSVLQVKNHAEIE